jgi:ferredoxin/flavodoxin
MKTIIYFFTGTGNSLAVAKKIAATLDECELVPIASLKDTTGEITPAAQHIGIVSPVYFSGLPMMVAEFAGRLDCSRAGYMFAVVTLGGSGGGPTLRQLDGIIRKKRGRGLDAGFSVKMPGNYIFMYSSPAGKKQADLLASADRRIAEMVPVIGRCEHRNIPLALFGRLIHAVAYSRFISHAHTTDRKFTVTHACTSCGTCVRICPAHNIDLVKGRPVWKGHCEVCCGCIHLCPEEAIQAGPRTVTRHRYRNPSVSITELEGPEGGMGGDEEKGK